MGCPLFVDYTRECMEGIGYCPQDTLEYCTGENYAQCPFYLLAKNPAEVCEHLRSCPVCTRFRTANFAQFVVMASRYCLTADKAACKRYVLRRAGEPVPDDLLPDGSRLDT